MTAVRRLASGKWVVDGGEQAPLLDNCPCCGLPFQSEGAAQAVVVVIERGDLTFGQALEQADKWRTILTSQQQ